MEALRKQLEEAQRTAQEGSGQSSSTAAQIVQLQTDIGKLKRTLIEKVRSMGVWVVKVPVGVVGGCVGGNRGSTECREGRQGQSKGKID